MNTKYFAIFLLAVGLALGFIGGRKFPRSSPDPQPGAIAEGQPGQLPPLPKINVPKQPAPAPTTFARVTLDQLDAAIQAAMSENPPQRREDAMYRLAQSIDIADIPAALEKL